MSMDNPNLEPIENRSQPRLEEQTPFMVAELPFFGYIYLGASIIVAIASLWGFADKTITPGAFIVPAGIVIQGLVIGGLLQAIGYIAALLEEIADSVRD